MIIIRNLKKKITKKKIKFSYIKQDLADPNIYIICVPTPIKKNYLPDLSHIKKSISIISKYIKVGDVIILESTVYPGVTEKFTNFLEIKSY